MKSVIAAALFGLVLIASTEATALRTSGCGAKGAGQPESTMACACEECRKHAPYLDTGDDCTCHASDIMRTFENDATKTLKTNSKYGNTGDVNTGAKQLASGWMWHCRP